jgi:hypothetical protein
MTNERKKQLEEEFQRLNEKLAAPDVRAKVEAEARANISEVAHLHGRLLARSRQHAHRRFIR